MTIVVLLGFSTAGTPRLFDVAVGAGIGLLFSQVLLTPDPVRIIDLGAQQLLRRLADGFDKSAEALTTSDHDIAQTALAQISAAHDSLVALETGIGTARSSARWSLRGRLAAQQVAKTAELYDRRAIRLYASALLFSEALANVLRKNNVPPPWLKDRVTHIAHRCHGVTGETVDFTVTDEPSSDISWQFCIAHLSEVENALAAFTRL